MSATSRRRLFALGVITLALLVVLMVRPSSERRVSLFFHGFQFKKLNEAYAVFELTNASRHTITYGGNNSGPDYTWLRATPAGWTREGILYMGALDLPRPRTLAPSSGVVFGCWVVGELKPSKIEITYTDGQATSGVMRLLPRSIVRRLPWGKDRYTLETPIFSFGG
jgi:hypothetical protein